MLYPQMDDDYLEDGEINDEINDLTMETTKSVASQQMSSLRGKSSLMNSPIDSVFLKENSTVESDSLFGTSDTDLRTHPSNMFHDCDLRSDLNITHQKIPVINKGQNQYAVKAYKKQGLSEQFRASPTNIVLTHSKPEINKNLSSFGQNKRFFNENNNYESGNVYVPQTNIRAQSFYGPIQNPNFDHKSRGLLPLPLPQVSAEMFHPRLESTKFPLLPVPLNQMRPLILQEYPQRLPLFHSTYARMPIIERPPEISTNSMPNDHLGYAVPFQHSPHTFQSISSEISPPIRESQMTDNRSETIVLGIEDITEVQMEDCTKASSALSPYDPGEDLYVSTPVPVVSPPKSLSTQWESEFKCSDNTMAQSNREHYDRELDMFINKFKNACREETIDIPRPETDNRTLKRVNRSDSEERRERLQRLLRGNETINGNGNEKSLHKITEKIPVKSNGRSPYLVKHKPNCSKKRKDIQSKSEGSRRKFKRQEKRRVITIKTPSSVRRPFVKKKIEEATYDELLDEYRNIQHQLIELDKVNHPQSDADEEKEEGELNESDAIVSVSEVNAGKSTIVAEDDIEYDEEELNMLRKLALESRKDKHNDTKANESEVQKTDEELDEADLLRAELIRSLLNQRAVSNKTPETDSNEKTHANQTVQPSNNLINDNVENLANQNSAVRLNIEKSSVKGNALNSVNKVKEMIINFGDDSSDEETDRQNQKRNTKGAIYSSIDLFLKEERSKVPSPKPLSAKMANAKLVDKLSSSQQKEYQKLIDEIKRREQLCPNKELLEKNENNWKESKANLNTKRTKMNVLKIKVNAKRTALKKAQQHARKMQEAYLVATRVVRATALELNTINSQLKLTHESVTKEEQNVQGLQILCQKIGSRIYGNSYKLPISTPLKRTLSESMSPIRKRMKSETESMNKEEIADEKKRLQLRANELSERLKMLKNQPQTLVSQNSAAQTAVTKSVIQIPQINKKIENARRILKQIISKVFSSPLFYVSIPIDSFTEMTSDVKPLEHHIQVPVEKTIDNSNNDLDFSCFKSDYHSVLSHLHSYRLLGHKNKDITSSHLTNHLSPHEYLCRYDLCGTCNDGKCSMQHKGSYLLGSIEKLIDLILYRPKIAGCKEDLENRMTDDEMDTIRNKIQMYASDIMQLNSNLSQEDVCCKIAKQIRAEFNDEDICCLTRCLPRVMKTHYYDTTPLDDLTYRFRFKDNSLILNHKQISQLRINDPEINIKNRYFAPEGIPINAELEATLAADSGNIQLWIKLAYYYITKSITPKADSIDRALNVLSRALDKNRTNPELYEHFLYIYSNRVIRNGDEKCDLMKICKKIADYFPHYRVWKCYLSLCLSFKDKENVSFEMIDVILKNGEKFCDFEECSHQLLEVIFYRIRLYLEFGDTLKAVSILKEVLSHNDEPQLPRNMPKSIKDKLTASDVLFAWLCYIHLLCFNCLPLHCFEPFKQGFSHIINKKPFIFSSLPLNVKIEEIRKYFNDAINDCKSDPQLCLSLYLNLEFTCNSSKELTNNYKSYEKLLGECEWDFNLWNSLLLTKPLHTNLNNTIGIMKKSASYAICDINIIYTIALYYYEIGDNLSARKELRKIAHSYFNTVSYISDSDLKLAFHALLDKNDTENLHFLKIPKYDKSNSVLILLCYILTLKIDECPNDEIESAFKSALFMFSAEPISNFDMHLLWWNYIKFISETVQTQWQFNNLTALIRHCCVAFCDESFQYQLIEFYLKLISNVNDRLTAAIQFVKLLPENIFVALNFLSLAIKLDRKDVCSEIINYIIFKKKLRPVNTAFWKISLSLAIEKNDYLLVHKLFQLALSLLPYNRSLWNMFFKYEMSINHLEHLKQGRDVCNNTLNIKFTPVSVT